MQQRGGHAVEQYDIRLLNADYSVHARLMCSCAGDESAIEQARLNVGRRSCAEVWLGKRLVAAITTGYSAQPIRVVLGGTHRVGLPG